MYRTKITTILAAIFTVIFAAIFVVNFIILKHENSTMGLTIF
jgi:hypothetical protein